MGPKSSASTILYSNPGTEIALIHHEKWNGKATPNGLAGEDIPLSARIVAVADVFDALTLIVLNKKAWPEQKALDLLQEEAGSHFDPSVDPPVYQNTSQGQGSPGKIL